MKKQLQIISSAMSKEINPLGEKPVLPPNYSEWQYFELEDWQQAESSLKEYRIDLQSWKDYCYKELNGDSNIVIHPIDDITAIRLLEAEAGKIHNFETNEELNTCVIL